MRWAVAAALLVALVVAGGPVSTYAGPASAETAACSAVWQEDSALALFQKRGARAIVKLEEQEADPQALLQGRLVSSRQRQEELESQAPSSSELLLVAAVSNGEGAAAASAGKAASSSVPSDEREDAGVSLAAALSQEGVDWKRFFVAIAVLLLLLFTGLLLRACKDRAVYGHPARSARFGSLVRLKTAVLVAALCHFSMAYNTGIIASAWLYLHQDTKFMHFDDWAAGAGTCSLLVGAAIGALGSSTADIVGRRLALLSVAALYVAGAALVAVAPGATVLLIGRAVAGLGCGMCSVVVNVYISEIAPADCRGQLSGWAPALGVLGVLASQCVALLFGSMFQSGAWRCQLAVAGVPALMVILLQGLLVESPRWLLLKGRREQAIAAMAALFPSAPQDTVANEVRSLEATIDPTKVGQQLNITELCRRYSGSVSVGLGINVLQQVAGINAVVYFGPAILEELSLDGKGALLAAIGVCTVQLCAVAWCSSVVDQLGRRSVAISGMSAIICAHILLVIAFAAKSASGGNWQVVAMAVGLLLFSAAFSFSLGPLAYIMTAELFPADARAAGVALCFAANWGAKLLLCQSLPAVTDKLTWLVGKDAGDSLIFAFYLSVCIVAFVAVLRALPETRGRQLERVLENKESVPASSSSAS